MTEKEAAGMLQAKLTCMKLEDLFCVGEGCSRDCNDCEYNYKQGTIGEYEKALEMAIKALEEIQQYWEIGTVTECREAVKAKRTVKPKFLHMLNDTRYRARCECGNIIIADIDVSNNPKYCSVCGKKLDWSEEDE